MDVGHDEAVSGIAAAIGEPARARMLYSLADGRPRTSTELAMLAGVTPSTASVHLKRLAAQQLVKVFAQGKHRYFSLNGDDVAVALEALGVLAGSRERLVTRTPQVLRAARTCYDHIAGTLGVLLHDRMRELRWFDHAYELTPAGSKAFEALGIDVKAARGLRRPAAGRAEEKVGPAGPRQPRADDHAHRAARAARAVRSRGPPRLTPRDA